MKRVIRSTTEGYAGPSVFASVCTAADLQKGMWVVVKGGSGRVGERPVYIPVCVESVSQYFGLSSIRGWAYNERLHEYMVSAIVYLAQDEADAEAWIAEAKTRI